MARKIRSMKGEEVDFDLLQIKSRLEKTEKPVDVKTREDFVHMKRKRRGNSKVSELISKRLEEEKPKKKNDTVEEQKVSSNADDISPEVKEPEPIEQEHKPKKKKRKIVKKDDK